MLQEGNNSGKCARAVPKTVFGQRICILLLYVPVVTTILLIGKRLIVSKKKRGKYERRRLLKLAILNSLQRKIWKGKNSLVVLEWDVNFMVTILYLINESKEQKVSLFWEVVDTVCMRCKQQLCNNYFWGYFCTLLSQLNFSIKMCGSLLSKFKFSNNKINPAVMIFSGAATSRE